MNTNTSKIAIRDRGMHNVTHYVTEGIGLTIDSITKNGAGFIKRWNLSTQTEYIY